jgi:hypothetical protein
MLFLAGVTGTKVDVHGVAARDRSDSFALDFELALDRAIEIDRSGPSGPRLKMRDF